jgi:hypothetical protein
VSQVYSGFAGLGLVVAFALLAALSTIGIWVLLSLFTTDPFAIDSLGFGSMTAGAVGPILVMLLVRRATRTSLVPKKRRLRVTSVIGSVTVLVIETIYLVLLGIFTLAYSGVRM